MNYSNEQQQIIDYIKDSKKKELILVNSVAGSGKTTLLRGISNSLPNSEALYLAYNKSIADDSKNKFPANVDCRTTHSLAFKHIFKSRKYKLGTFSPASMQDNVSHIVKTFVVKTIQCFCLSKYTDFSEFYKERLTEIIPTENLSQHQFSSQVFNIAQKYLNLMADAKIGITHEFYLKLFHLKLHNNSIKSPEYDLIMIDEAGDINEVTLEIFLLLEAKIKVAVGDPLQNIYIFNNTINCFEILKDKATSFNLSQSFRVPEITAERIQSFCKKYINPDIVFKGILQKTKESKTTAYIARTNASVVKQIIEFDKAGKAYKLVRPAKEIFNLPITVAALKPNGKVYNSSYAYLQDIINEYHENSNISRVYPNFYSYLKDQCKEDLAVLSAIGLATNFSSSVLFNTYSKAKEL